MHWAQATLTALAIVLTALAAGMTYQQRLTHRALESFSYAEVMALRENVWYSLRPILAQATLGLAAALVAVSAIIAAIRRQGVSIALAVVCAVVLLGGMLYVFALT